MDAVLGLSMTPTTVGLVLVEGQDADGATIDKDEFAVHDRGLASAIGASAAAVLRAEAIAAARGHRLHSIGVTWSQDADTEASLLLESLSESGFDNVVAVRLPEATEALARGIADVIGYETTAVCVIQPDAVVVLVVDTVEDAVQTAVNHSINTDEDLARWLSAIFAQAEWLPEALVLVGSCADLHAITLHLEEVLAVPVFVPAEAQLALAKGAAMASAQGPDFFVDDAVAETGRAGTERRRSWPISPVGAASAMLGAGVVTFVVSGSLAIGLQLTSGKSAQPVAKPPAASTSNAQAAVKAALPEPAAAPPAVEATLPPAPAADLPAPPLEATIEPAPFAEAVLPEAPADPLPPPDGVTPYPAGAPVPAGTAPLPPGAVEPVPPAVPAPVAQVPQEKPGLLQRLRDKLSGIGQPDDPSPPVDQAPVPPLPQDIPPPPPA